MIELTKKPKSPTIIEGFPGFGLVGTIGTEFLIDTLKAERIGRILFEEMPAMVAIHDNKVIEPFGVFYDKKYNLVILHATYASKGLEWKIADIVRELAQQLNAKEVISLEGVGSPNQDAKTGSTFFYTSDEKKKKKLEKGGLIPLKEGIIIGVTGSLLLKIKKRPVTALFVEAETQMPDSSAAAQLIEALDVYMGFKLDTKPLLEQATLFEEKFKGIMSKSKAAEELSEKKAMSYVG